MICKNGVLEPTIPGQFDGQIHSVEWFHNGAWRRIPDTIYPLQDSEILDDTLDCGGFCFTNQLKPFPDERIKDENGNWFDNPNSLKNLKQLMPIRILWDSEEDFETEDRSTDFDKNLVLQLDGKIPVKKPMWRYRIVDEINVHGEGMMFKVTVKTIEATKLLELVQCDTLTFTNYLINRDLIPQSMYAMGTTYYPTPTAADVGLKYNVIKTPFRVGSSCELPYANQVFKLKNGVSYSAYRIYVQKPSSVNKEKIFESVHITDWSDWDDSGNRIVSFDEEGTYSVYYEIDQEKNLWGNRLIYTTGRKFEISVFDELPDHTKLTIARILERILYAGETRREDIDEQRFELANSIYEKYKDRISPEFSLTRSTMWEALKTPAGHVHCVPRLNWDENSNAYRIITFDELGRMEECKLKAMHNNTPIAWDIRKSLDSYCGEINSYVDNLVNTRDDIVGTITEPYDGGWKSVRAKDGEFIIIDDSAAFIMSRPNMRISKLEIKYGDKEADITKYLFEEAEYRTLSTFEGTFPYSTGYALKFEQGGSEITELAHISKSEMEIIPDIGDIFKTEAIINIGKAEGLDIASGDFRNILYRVTYSPISSARIVEEKPYIEDCNGYSRNYNIAGNMIESEYLGEHLKGAIARLGNDIEYRTYMFERGKDVPKPGTILDGKYIMKVTTQMSSVRFIKATLMLSSNYNQKNEYVAIDSNVRYYDVSEKQSVERHVNYKEKVVIGDKVNSNDVLTTTIDYSIFCGVAQTEISGGVSAYYGTTSFDFFDGEIVSAVPSNAQHNVTISGSTIRITASSRLIKRTVEGSLAIKYHKLLNSPMASPAAVELFAKIFSGGVANSRISWAWFRGDSANRIFLPCLSQACGNSLVFNFACQDNYAAGWNIVKEGGGEIIKRIQTQVSYADAFGEFEKLEIRMGNSDGLPNEKAVEEMARELPLWTAQTTPEGLLFTGSNPLIISKDSREKLNFTYQLNCVANRRDIIIGSALCRQNPLVANVKDRYIECFFLPDKINKFATTIDVTNGYAAWGSLTFDNVDGRRFCLSSGINLSAFEAKSVAWVDASDGSSNAKLLIGENIDIPITQKSKDIWFSFVANDVEV